MRIYNRTRRVPTSAQKTIAAGRLKGFTDISPMWRIKKLTEEFGPAGVGWYTQILNKEVVDGPNGEKMCFIDLNLFYREAPQAEWSAPIYGTGGSFLVAKESSGLRPDDESWKKAYTDALGVACKAIGIGADVYWKADAGNTGAAGTGNGSRAAAPTKPVARPAILDTNPKQVTQEEINAVVQYYYRPIAKTEAGKAFVQKCKDILGSKNYLDIPDAGKRLELFKLVKELAKPHD